MAKELGVGVIGLGMGRDLLYLNRDPATRLEVRGLCGRNADKAARMAKSNGIGFATADYRELLKRDDIQVIAVFSPDHLHGEQCVAALEAGKHVLVEKPLATNAADAEELRALAASRRLTLMPGHTFLYSPAVNWVRELLRLRTRSARSTSSR